MPLHRTFAIVGAGRLGSAIASALHTSGAVVSELVVRNRPSSIKAAKPLSRTVCAKVLTDASKCTAQVVWVCVADSEIAKVARQMAKAGEWPGRAVLHSSGALSSDELDPLRRRGAHVASVHPMMSFVHGVRPALQGVTFAMEGDEQALRVARQVVRKWKARAIEIRKQDKALYHAWGAFLSPLIVAELATSEKVAAAVGISPVEARKVMAPILRQTIDNYLEHGPEAAFSGPIVRGDAETVRRHLQALKNVSPANDVYLSLARAAVDLLPAANRQKLKKLLR
jgi:predicted short-subunit dehydrogenase-like oxidoreductase (DUF2520 family)